MTVRHRLVTGLLLASALLLPATALRAHPTAQTFVVITLEDRGAVTVAMSSDARALGLKAEALGGSLAGHLDLRFDGIRAPLTLREIRGLPERPGFVTAVFGGTVPASARQLSFRSALILGAYPLLVRRARDADAAADRYEWLSGGEASRAYDVQAPDRARGSSAFFEAVRLGFTHIVPRGLDHMLFVLGLFLLTTRAGAILAQVTAFTAAHSAALALGALELVAVPAGIVEPLIALSIVYVGVENLRSTAIGRGRVAAVFAFGLLHGLGFAEALAAMDLSGRAWLATLAGFNAGVELGQLAVIASAAIAIGMLRVRPSARRAVVVRPGSIAIAAAGLVWLVERTF
jgi:hypothetical protein